MNNNRRSEHGRRTDALHNLTAVADLLGVQAAQAEGCSERAQPCKHQVR